MDEWTLNDLLECSVCLERLDTSSRVLPCQHTFCKKCLEEIVHTHKKLRCPECRVVVEIGVDDLPPNVLLMRILEGMRNAPRKSGSGNTNHVPETECNTISSNSTQVVSASFSEHSCRSKVIHRPRPRISDIQQPHAIALYNFTAKEPGDLSFRKGDVILLRRKIDNNWYQGECNGLSGVFPLPYVKVIVPMPPGHNTSAPSSHASRMPQCKALYDFNKYHEDDEGCLHFNKGDVINVIRRIDENWAEGKLEERIGIFPISFVVMNSLAKTLMMVSIRDNHARSRDAPPTPTDDAAPLIAGEQARSTANSYNLAQLPAFVDALMSPLSVSSSSSAQSTATTTSPSSSSDSTTPPSPTLSPLSNHAAVKRHSYTMGALPPPYHAPPTVHRHSAEIINSDSNHILDNSTSSLDHQLLPHSLQSQQNSSPQVQQQPQSLPLQPENSQQKNVKIDERNFLLLQKSQTNGVEDNFPRHGSFRALKQQALRSKFDSHMQISAQVPLPARYIALYPYKPQKNDELELKKDNVYTVIERCQDGWYKGNSYPIPNQKCGVFPGNYVAPVKGLSAIPTQLHGLMVNSRSAIRSPDVQISTSSVKPLSMANVAKTGFSIGAERGIVNDGNAPPELPPRSLSPVLPVSSHSTSKIWYPNSQENNQAVSRPHTLSTTSYKSTTSHMKSMNESGDGNTSVSGTNIVVTSNNSHLRETVKSPKLAEKNKDRKDRNSGVSLMKRLTSMKKSRSPPPATYSVDNPLFEDGFSSVPARSHARSDSCPSQLSYNTSSLDNSTANITATGTASRRIYSPANSERMKPKHRTAIHTENSRRNVKPSSNSNKEEKPVVNHQKSSSLDTTNTTVVDENLMSLHKYRQVSVTRERYRCIVPYPPNSEFELELQTGDIIYVSKKRDDGWYKGTLQRNGRTGLFPASFVEYIKEL